MRYFRLIILLLLIAPVTCGAQNEYSLENLETYSQDELDMYLEKALKRQKTGKVVTIVGGSILGATALSIGIMAIIDSGDWALAAAGIAFLGGITGLGTMAVGIPMNISGKKRVERINSVKNKSYSQITLDLSPSFQYNRVINHHQPCLTLKIKF